MNIWGQRCGILLMATSLGIPALCGALLAPAQRLGAQTQSVSPTTSAVTIVLPPKVVAGQPATLAVLGTDGRVAPNVAVNLGGNLHVTTDKTGRAVFNVPVSGTVLFAKASGNSAVALIDPQPHAPLVSPATASVAPVVA